MNNISLSELLDIKIGVTSIIGSGGKTTLIHKLANELKNKGKVIFTTTTHIFPSSTIPSINNPTISNIQDFFLSNNCLCIGKYDHKSKKYSSPDISFEKLCKIADYVLVEADGSKGLPIKAHEDFEPVLPVESNQIIQIIGADGFNKTIKDVAHRCKIFAKLTDSTILDIATAERVANVIKTENYADKIFINKCTKDINQPDIATIAEITGLEVFYGALMEEKWYAYNN
ncbi:MAG: selenium cofactor biosynthesis protein YqeC [Clostridia bacterium]|nr:selenium cofactor biosynthesis protein YqeC [Clostridia bacterium]